MSYSFNGSTDYITCGTSDLSTGVYTVAAWIKPTGLTGNHTILTQQDTWGTANKFDVLQVNDALMATQAAVYDFLIPTTRLSTSAWNLIVVAVDGTNAKGYIGTSSNVATSTADLLADSGSGSTIRIGMVGTSTDPFAGKIAEVAVWSTKLGTTDINLLAAGDNPATVSPGSLVEYWRLYDNATSNSGTRNGTVTGATADTADHPSVDAPPGSSSARRISCGIVG